MEKKKEKRWKLERYAPIWFFFSCHPEMAKILVMWNFYISETYNVIISQHSFFEGGGLVFRSQHFIHLNIRPDPRLCVGFFFADIDCTVSKHGEEFQTKFFRVTDLKETSIDVGVVADGAVLVVAHNLDHLLMQLLSCTEMQAHRPRCCGKSSKKCKEPRLEFDALRPTTLKNKVFLFSDKVLVPQQLSKVTFVCFLDLMSLFLRFPPEIYKRCSTVEVNRQILMTEKC